MTSTGKQNGLKVPWVLKFELPPAIPIAIYRFAVHSVWGYFWMTANCFSTAGYVLTMKFATRTMKLPKFGMVFYNNLLGKSHVESWHFCM